MMRLSRPFAAETSGRAALLSAHGIGGLRFGTPKARRERRLSKLTTARGIGLRSTLGEVRRRYRKPTLAGTDRWQSRDGLVFYDSARREPPQAASRIIEIEYGTCGDV